MVDLQVVEIFLFRVLAFPVLEGFTRIYLDVSFMIRFVALSHNLESNFTFLDRCSSSS